MSNDYELPAHVCWTDDTTCDLCGGNIGLHVYNCNCDECRKENYEEACDTLGY